MDNRKKQGPGWFSTTRWSLVLEAAESESPRGEAALNDLCERYWYPLYAYVRRRGYGTEQARDLTQEFFLRLLNTKALQAADPERGKFRSFLLVSLKNFLANQWDRETALKRGGGRVPVPLDFEDAERRYHCEPAEQLSPEQIYERQWTRVLLDRVTRTLQDEMVRAGKAKRFDILKGYLSGEADDVSYAAAARTLDMTEGAVKVAVYRLRRRFGALIRAEVADTVAEGDAVEDEIRYLLSSFSPG